MFGGAAKEVLNEDSPFDPKSPYAASKVFAHNMTKLYRDSYDLFCVNGILFNHESPMRGETFVTRKITRAVGRIKLGLQKKLTLGNLEASRDWGFSGDYVEGMWMMLQHDKPDDFVLATGKSITVKEFAELAFSNQGLDYQNFVETSERYFRPNEVEYLLGDYSKAKSNLGWEPKTNIKDLVSMMVEEDLLLAKREKVLMNEGLLKPTWENPS
jgi:GDPmannose 4,6-dehydratase